MSKTIYFTMLRWFMDFNGITPYYGACIMAQLKALPLQDRELTVSFYD